MERISYTGYLIDAQAKTITSVELTTLDDYYSYLDCTMVQSAGSFRNGDDLIVDEEGLLTCKPMEASWFMFPEVNAQPLVGRGIVVGVKYGTDGADWTTPKSTEKELINRVHFISPRVASELFEIISGQQIPKQEGVTVIDCRFNPFE